jgi:hypothetical protein
MLLVVNSSMITPYSRKNLKNIRSSYSASLLQSQRSKLNNNDSNNNTYTYPDNVAINSLDIADGLKELLIKYGFTLEVLLNTSSSEIAEFLGIDQHVAEIICTAARKSSNHYRQYYSMRFYP